MKLTACTLTGVDETSDIRDIANLSERFPFVEWGFLYSPTRQGTPGRYPSIPTLERFFLELPATVKVALHVCGKGVDEALANSLPALGLIELVAKRNGRVQLNFNAKRNRIDFNLLRNLMDTFPGITFITQRNEANAGVVDELDGHTNLAVLFDSSGGNGVETDKWEIPLDIPCGYAGGISAENVREKLVNLAGVVGERDTWIDMEGKIRTDDKLDFSKCESVLSNVKQWMTDI